MTTGKCNGTALTPGGVTSIVGPDASTGNGLVDAHKAVLSAKVQCLGPIQPITVQPIQPIKPISPVVLPPPTAMAGDAAPEQGQATLSEEDVAALQDLIANSDFDPGK